jgi:hypothetical protein
VIELLSGRLAIGADQYRRITRRARASSWVEAEQVPPLTICAAGTSESGKSGLIAGLRAACSGDLTLLKARLANLAVDPELLERLRTARWVESPDYPAWSETEGRRDRARRQAAVDVAVQADLLILAIDGRRGNIMADAAFAQAWDRWFVGHPRNEVPPALVVLTGVEGPEFGGDWHPPYDWSSGQGARETAVRDRFEGLHASLPPSFADFVAVSLSEPRPFGVVEQLLPVLAARLHRAERTALIRRLQEVGGRSKLGRLASQIGQQGRALWSGLKARRKAGSASQ